MKSKTTTREYDADGNMTKEVVTEYDDSGVQMVPAVCNCTVGAYRYCPLHGYRYGYGHWYSPTITSPTFTINTSGTTGHSTSAVVAATVRTHAAAMGR